MHADTDSLDVRAAAPRTMRGRDAITLTRACAPTTLAVAGLKRTLVLACMLLRRMPRGGGVRTGSGLLTQRTALRDAVDPFASLDWGDREWS